RVSYRLLAEGEDVTGREDQVLLALDLDLRAAVLRVDDPVADPHVHRDSVTVLEPSRPNRHDFALLRALLGGIGDDDAGRRRVVVFAGMDRDAILQRLQTE